MCVVGTMHGLMSLGSCYWFLHMSKVIARACGVVTCKICVDNAGLARKVVAWWWVLFQNLECG